MHYSEPDMLRLTIPWRFDLFLTATVRITAPYFKESCVREAQLYKLAEAVCKRHSYIREVKLYA